jgi:hypothetical protein
VLESIRWLVEDSQQPQQQLPWLLSLLIAWFGFAFFSLQHRQSERKK